MLWVYFFIKRVYYRDSWGVVLSENSKKVAIIGNGCAAAECIKALRESGYGGEVHVFTDSEWPVYNPMLTTYYIAGKITFDRLFPYGGDEFYRQYQVEVHTGSPVISLEAENRVVANRAGFELNYEQCLIASGASPVLPTIEGLRSHNVYLMRTVEDAIRLKDALAEKPRRALVIGASLVGIKLVELFHTAGMEVCLADLADQVFPLNAHPECARIIGDRLSGMGIKLKLGAGLSRIEDGPTGIRAYFGDGREGEESDLLALCTGVRPNISFIDRSQVG
jgi:NAD(P)H-nitrite reductase large subunit